MEKRVNKKWEYYWRAIKWLGGNLCFSLFPLLLMCTLYLFSDGKIGGRDVSHQIYEGTILFVCLALVGSVVCDVWLSGFHFEGVYRVFVYAVPALILFILTINYLLIKFDLLISRVLGSGHIPPKW